MSMRNPQSRSANPRSTKERRSPKSEQEGKTGSFGPRPSGFFRISAFGFRTFSNQAAGYALIFSLCLIGCKDKPRTNSQSPPTVEVVTVTQADVPIYHEWIGVLDGLVNAQIRAQVTGYLLTQNYREDDLIKKDDLLFEIDPRPFKAALDQANGLLAQAEAKLGKTDLDVKRYRPLVKDKAISQEEFDDAFQANMEAKAAVVSAKAQVEQAQLNLDFTKIRSPI